MNGLTGLYVALPIKDRQRVVAVLRTALPATTVEKVNLADVFQAAIQLCRPKAEEKKIRIDLDCEKDTTAIFDPALIEQAYGGHVAVESKLGEGSRFSIHQPQTQ